MTPRPTIKDDGRWMAWAVRTACAGVLACWIAVPVVMAQATAPAGPTAYRCGSQYSSTPCPGGSVVDNNDARSPAQQREAQEMRRRDAALADQMTAERQTRERNTPVQPAIGIGPPAAAQAPKHAASAPTGTKKKKKIVAKKPVTTTPKKLGSAGVPG